MRAAGENQERARTYLPVKLLSLSFSGCELGGMVRPRHVARDGTSLLWFVWNKFWKLGWNLAELAEVTTNYPQID